LADAGAPESLGVIPAFTSADDASAPIPYPNFVPNGAV
jgi:hypothetical protein